MLKPLAISAKPCLIKFQLDFDCTEDFRGMGQGQWLQL